MQDERRRDPRYATRLRVWCEGQATTLYVPVTNVSAGGMFIRTVSPLAAGEELRVVLQPDAREPDKVVAVGSVAWSRARGDEGTPGMGVTLVRFERGEEVFQRLLQRLSRRASTGSQRIDQREIAAALRDQDGSEKSPE